MEFQGKALYNLIRISWLEEPNIAASPWQVEDLRSVSLETLFHRLEALNLKISPESFLASSEEADSPEELIDLLWEDEQDVEGYDQAYLLIFELWRRLLPQKFSLSVFCDELDWRIYLYDRDLLSEDDLLEAVADLEDLLDESVDHGGEPKAIFQIIESFCAHDLERFFYDYINESIDKQEEVEASELLDEFYTYISNTRWFDFLRARLLFAADAEEATLMLERLMEELEEEPDLDLLFEVASYLVTQADPSLFLRCTKILAKQIKDEEKFQEMIKLVAEYFCCLDKDTHHKIAQTLLLERKHRSLEAPLTSADFKALHSLLDS